MSLRSVRAWGGMPRPRPLSSRASNHVAEPVSRRPRSPKRRKTKRRRGAKVPFNGRTRPGIRFDASEPDIAADCRRFSAFCRLFPAVLFMCSKGRLETVVPCPISSVVFLLLDSPCCRCEREHDGSGGLLLGGESAKHHRHTPTASARTAATASAPPRGTSGRRRTSGGT